MSWAVKFGAGWSADHKETMDALYRIVRCSMLGVAIGHEHIMLARRVVKRQLPAEYAKLAERRRKAGLPPALGAPLPTANSANGESRPSETEEKSANI